MQLASSRQNSSQSQNGIKLKSYPAAGTRVKCRMESDVTCIQPPELQAAMGQSQPQLKSSWWNLSQPWDGVGRNLYPAARTRVSFNSYLAAGTRDSCNSCLATGTQVGRNSYSAAFQKLIFQYLTGILDFNKYSYVY